MLLELKKGITYGPVNSRRLGASLGINLLPGGCKACTFDCLYCQYGFRATIGPGETAHLSFPAADDVSRALKSAIAALPTPPRFLTFSGNGEPSLHPEFPEVVERVLRVRDERVPSASVAILSNSSTASDPVVRGALSMLDSRIMKLDAGTEAELSRFNRPRRGLSLGGIAEGLARLPDITVQALFAAGDAGNMAEDHIRAWVARILEIRPIRVQVYTLARSSPCRTLEPARPEALGSIARRLGAAGVAAEVF